MFEFADFHYPKTTFKKKKINHAGQCVDFSSRVFIDTGFFLVFSLFKIVVSVNMRFRCSSQ